MFLLLTSYVHFNSSPYLVEPRPIGPGSLIRDDGDQPRGRRRKAEFTDRPGLLSPRLTRVVTNPVIVTRAFSPPTRVNRDCPRCVFPLDSDDSLVTRSSVHLICLSHKEPQVTSTDTRNITPRLIASSKWSSFQEFRSVQARENIPPMPKFKMLSSSQDLTSNHVGEKQSLYHLCMRTYAMLTLTKIPILLVPQRRGIFLLYTDS